MVCDNVFTKVFKSKASSISGSSYNEVIGRVRKEEDKIRRLTMRRPYVRSSYFVEGKNKSKVFIENFLPHIMQKGRKTRVKRLKLYNGAIDLLRNSRHEPEVILKSDLPAHILYKFHGVTKDGVQFCVQVKQHKRTGRKDFMSVYPKDSP